MFKYDQISNQKKGNVTNKQFVSVNLLNIIPGTYIYTLLMYMANIKLKIYLQLTVVLKLNFITVIKIA